MFHTWNYKDMNSKFNNPQNVGPNELCVYAIVDYLWGGRANKTMNKNLIFAIHNKDQNQL